MRIAWLGAGAALSFIIAAGCSSQERVEKTSTARQPIQGAELDPDTVHKYAVGVSSGSGICSGALIAPNVVVTARHCVQAIDYKNPDVPETIDCSLNPSFIGGVKNMSVTTDTSFSGAQWRAVKQVVLPTTNSVCNNDIALLVLTNLVAGTTAKPVIPGVQYPINYSKYLTSFTAIGYGNTSATGGGAGTRRMRQLIRIQCIPGDETIPCPPGFGENEFVAGDGTCSGDSGSSAFEQGSFTFDTPVSLGVLSRGGQDKTTCVGSIYTRLDKFRDLIINTVESASNNWTLYPKPSPDWTVYVPPEVKDAGSPKPDAGTKPAPTGLGFGEACDVDADCASKICEGYCTTGCPNGDSSTCPEGYECREDLCLLPATPASDPGAPGSTTTTESCNTTGGPTPWGTLVLAGAVAIGLSGRRRRRA